MSRAPLPSSLPRRPSTSTNENEHLRCFPSSDGPLPRDLPPSPHLAIAIAVNGLSTIGLRAQFVEVVVVVFAMLLSFSNPDLTIVVAVTVDALFPIVVVNGSYQLSLE